MQPKAYQQPGVQVRRKPRCSSRSGSADADASASDPSSPIQRLTSSLANKLSLPALPETSHTHTHKAKQAAWRAGQATASVQQQIREGKLQANLQTGAGMAAERGKEYGTKGWGFMKSAYASMAQQVEHLARDNGYQLDLGTSQHLST